MAACHLFGTGGRIMNVRELLDNICSAYYIITIKQPGGAWVGYGSKKEVDKGWMDMHVDGFKYYSNPNELVIIAEHERG